MGTHIPVRKRIPNRERLSAEDDALNQIAREAEARLAAKRAARAEAREIRMKELERQQKEVSDEDERMSVGSRGSLRVEERPEKDFGEKGSRTTSSLSAATLASLGGTSSRRGSGDTIASVDTEASIREIKDSLAEVEEKYRKAMVSNAQLDNEKNTLMYQVDTLQDVLLEVEEHLAESNREFQEKAKELEREKHAHSVLQFQFEEIKESLKQREEMLMEIKRLTHSKETSAREISDLQETIEWKDKKIGAHGLVVSEVLNGDGGREGDSHTDPAEVASRDAAPQLPNCPDGPLGKTQEMEMRNEILENVGRKGVFQNAGNDAEQMEKTGDEEVIMDNVEGKEKQTGGHEKQCEDMIGTEKPTVSAADNGNVDQIGSKAAENLDGEQNAFGVGISEEKEVSQVVKVADDVDIDAGVQISAKAEESQRAIEVNDSQAQGRGSLSDIHTRADQFDGVHFGGTDCEMAEAVAPGVEDELGENVGRDGDGKSIAPEAEGELGEDVESDEDGNKRTLEEESKQIVDIIIKRAVEIVEREMGFSNVQEEFPKVEVTEEETVDQMQGDPSDAMWEEACELVCDKGDRGDEIMNEQSSISHVASDNAELSSACLDAEKHPGNLYENVDLGSVEVNMVEQGQSEQPGSCQETTGSIGNQLQDVSENVGNREEREQDQLEEKDITQTLVRERIDIELIAEEVKSATHGDQGNKIENSLHREQETETSAVKQRIGQNEEDTGRADPEQEVEAGRVRRAVDDDKLVPAQNKETGSQEKSDETQEMSRLGGSVETGFVQGSQNETIIESAAKGPGVGEAETKRQDVSEIKAETTTMEEDESGIKGEVKSPGEDEGQVRTDPEGEEPRCTDKQETLEKTVKETVLDEGEIKATQPDFHHRDVVVEAEEKEELKEKRVSEVVQGEPNDSGKHDRGKSEDVNEPEKVTKAAGNVSAGERRPALAGDEEEAETSKDSVVQESVEVGNGEAGQRAEISDEGEEAQLRLQMSEVAMNEKEPV
uniref:Leucine-rich repeat flightless-interacting protein 1 n=1 Tax=Callorhinchus milii TaxID=7868 RepID=A0A4W3H1B1_CALMI